MIINLTNIDFSKDGKRYEDQYGRYIEIFKKIAISPAYEEVTVKGAPWSWYPLLYHLQATGYDFKSVFEHCNIVKDAVHKLSRMDRTIIEVLCGFRPETSDCLWKTDMEWHCPPGRVKSYPPKKEFIVTTNGSYHRKEILDFFELLRAYKPVKKKVLLVPCAADKPYPSPLHQACLGLLPDDFYIANATGVLGIVPQDLWGQMPWYDSGIPNQWRLFEMVKSYFTLHPHDKIVVYCDFYAHVLFEAFHSIGILKNVSFVLPPIKYNNYENLLDQSKLQILKAMLV